MLKIILVLCFCILSQKNAQRIVSSNNKKPNLRMSPVAAKQKENEQKLEAMKKEISMIMIQYQNEMRNMKRHIEEKFRKMK